MKVYNPKGSKKRDKNGNHLTSSNKFDGLPEKSFRFDVSNIVSDKKKMGPLLSMMNQGKKIDS